MSFYVPSVGLSVPGYIYYVSWGQITLWVPWELQDETSAQAKMIMGGSTSSLMTVPITASAPVFFQFQLSGIGTPLASALDPKNALNTAPNPARRGQTAQLYSNGAPSQQLGKTTSRPAVTIGNKRATLSFGGLAPGPTLPMRPLELNQWS